MNIVINVVIKIRNDMVIMTSIQNNRRQIRYIILCNLFEVIGTDFGNVMYITM